MTMRRVTVAFLVIFALLNAYPIISLALGISPMGILTPITTLAGFTFALLHAGQREGWGRALRLLALVFGVSLLFESVGVATGWIYGPYHYTTKLGPLFLGLVPFLIPVAWFMMSYPSFVIADRLVGSAHHAGGEGAQRKNGWKRMLAVAAVGGMVMTAWDLVMDPVMVYSGHWVWDVAGPYHGIPLQNYWGWWLTVFTTFALYLLITGKGAKPADPGFDRLAVISYLITALGLILSCLVSGAGDLALVGFFSMLPWVIMGWVRTGD
jgi:putative membrane protein